MLLQAEVVAKIRVVALAVLSASRMETLMSIKITGLGCREDGEAKGNVEEVDKSELWLEDETCRD